MGAARRVCPDAPPRLISAGIFFGAASALHSFILREGKQDEGRPGARFTRVHSVGYGKAGTR
jgi:hypothetical protein